MTACIADGRGLRFASGFDGAATSIAFLPAHLIHRYEKLPLEENCQVLVTTNVLIFALSTPSLGPVRKHPVSCCVTYNQDTALVSVTYVIFLQIPNRYEYLF